MSRRSFLVLALGFVLAACAQVAVRTDRRDQLAIRSPVEAFHLEGRLSVKNDERSFSGGLQWHRAPAEEFLLLSTPLGQGVAELRRQDGGVVLKDSEGAEYRAESGEALLARVLGVSLPMDGMAWWLSALPRPAIPFTAEQDEEGRVITLEQDGWRIEYSRYEVREGRWLPSRLFARRDGGLEFRLVVDQWRTY